MTIVSIITPFYSESLGLLQRNTQSVYMQKLKGETKIEHLIIVDRPIEEVPENIRNYLDNLDGFETDSYLVKVLGKDINRGLSGARNIGLKNSSGDFICLLDTDDVMANDNRVQDQIDFMLENKLDHSYGGFQAIFLDGRIEDKVNIPPSDMEDEIMRGINPCFCGSNIFTKECAELIGEFDEHMKEGAEDFEYWIRIMKNKNLTSGLYPKVCYYLGITSDNMTAKLIANGGFGRAYEYIKKKHSDIQFKF